MTYTWAGVHVSNQPLSTSNRAVLASVRISLVRASEVDIAAAVLEPRSQTAALLLPTATDNTDFVILKDAHHHSVSGMKFFPPKIIMARNVHTKPLAPACLSSSA